MKKKMDNRIIGKATCLWCKRDMTTGEIMEHHRQCLMDPANKERFDRLIREIVEEYEKNKQNKDP